MYHSEEVFCQEIKVGDLLILKDNMIVPADCIVIKVPSNNGECQSCLSSNGFSQLSIKDK